MDDDKRSSGQEGGMSCGQEGGMSSGEAPTSCHHPDLSRPVGAAAGNFSMESLDLRQVFAVRELPASPKKKTPRGEANGNFSIQSRDLREESCNKLPTSPKKKKISLQGEARGNFSIPGEAPGIHKTQADVEESRRELPASCAQADVKVSCSALPASCRERNVKVSCCALGIFKTQADVEESCSELPASYAEMDVKVSCCGLGIFKKQSVRNFKTQSVTTPVSSPLSLPVFLPTIYKVPQRIRQRNKDEYEPYEPQIVSIGLYHHRKKEEFEEHKKGYQRSILFRNPKHVLEDYYTAISKLENKARNCCSEHLDCDKFVEIMVLDGCFIVELFLRNKEKKFKKDPIFSTIWMMPLIRYDMLLLENQIPFFVLEIIYEMASPGNGSFVKLALDFFERIIPMNEENKIEVSEDLINGHYFHLLHLFHSYLMPTPREKSQKCKILMKGSNEAKLPIKNTTIKNPSRNTTIMMIPCAAELKLSGVKFKKKKDFSSFLDVKFSGGVLEIPHLCIDDYTNTLLRNLVALEQFCYPGVKTIHFTNYVGFMDCLVNTSKDVALLHRKGIIDHLLGSDGHVADLFNQLCYGIFNDFEDHNYLSGIYKDVDKYYNTPWNTRRANLKSNYFTNPWASLSTAAAVILLLLTFLQTFYTIFAYHRPAS